MAGWVGRVAPSRKNRLYEERDANRESPRKPRTGWQGNGGRGMSVPVSFAYIPLPGGCSGLGWTRKSVSNGALLRLSSFSIFLEIVPGRGEQRRRILDLTELPPHASA